MSATPVYLDFELSIVDLGGGRYRASVEDMPLGESQPDVSHEFTLPFSDDELARVLGILSGLVSVPSSERARQARTFGEALFQAVFAGPVYTVYFSSRDRARTSQGLRVKLSLDRAGALASLPWEFLRDPAVDYLAVASDAAGPLSAPAGDPVAPGLQPLCGCWCWCPLRWTCRRSMWRRNGLPCWLHRGCGRAAWWS